jgi:hypothetical protein
MQAAAHPSSISWQRILAASEQQPGLLRSCCLFIAFPHGEAQIPSTGCAPDTQHSMRAPMVVPDLLPYLLQTRWDNTMGVNTTGTKKQEPCLSLTYSTVLYTAGKSRCPAEAGGVGGAGCTFSCPYPQFLFYKTACGGCHLAAGSSGAQTGLRHCLIQLVLIVPAGPALPQEALRRPVQSPHPPDRGRRPPN